MRAVAWSGHGRAPALVLGMESAGYGPPPRSSWVNRSSGSWSWYHAAEHVSTVGRAVLRRSAAATTWPRQVSRSCMRQGRQRCWSDSAMWTRNRDAARATLATERAYFDR